MIRTILALCSCFPLLASWQCPIEKTCKCYNSSIDDSDLFRRCEKVFFFNPEFLYWKVEQGADDYAIKMTKPARNALNNLQAQGNYQRASFDWEPGFRITVGYFNAPKHWEVKGQYTWLYSKGTNSASPSAANLFLNGTFTQYLTPPLVRAETKIQLHYHVANFLVDRMFIPNPHLRLRLIAGATGAFFDQKWRIRYLDGINITTIMNEWKFNGAGFRSGMSADWFLGKDFYLTGQASFGLLVGRYENFSDIITSENVTGFDNVDLPYKDTRFKDTRVVFNPQFYLGPSYQRSFPCWRFDFFAGYEINAWFNVVEVFRSTQQSASQSKETLLNRSVLGLHGLTVRLTIDF